MGHASTARSRVPRKNSATTQKASSTKTGTSGTSTKQCKSCGSTTRKLTTPGPRCATCHRDRRTTVQLARRLAYVSKQYNLTPEQYQALWDLSGGLCYGCRRNKGRCVDHDHACCPGKVSCGKCVRGLLCGPCNKGVLGHLRDDVRSLMRLVEYLEDPPAYKVIPR
jgi:hypothetical protein